MRDLSQSPIPLPLDVLDRWVAGTPTADDREILNWWLVDRPGAESLLRAVGGDDRSKTDITAELRDCLMVQLGLQVPVAGTVVQTPAKRPIRGLRVGRDAQYGESRPWSFSRARWMVGAALLICVLGLVSGRNAWFHRLLRPHTSVVATYITTNGQRANIVLPDGTKVALDVASRLDIPSDYTTGDRIVRLSGRALFTVSHHSGTPFIVRTGGVSARVLGTTFVVRRYPADTTTLVAVRDGRVVVSDTADGGVRDAVVTAARMIEIGRPGTSRIRMTGVSPFLFATGVLAVDSMRLADAIPELDRWYDVEIRLGDPALGARVVEGRFPAGARSDLAEVLEWMFDARVVRDGRVLTLFPRTVR